MTSSQTPERCVLENVPRIHFYEGGKFCPEDICFPSALKSCLEFMGDPIGCKHTCPPTVGLACCGYPYLVGATGEALALSWSPDWEFSNAIRSLAAGRLAAEHDLMWQVWDAAGGNGNPEAWAGLADPAVRHRIIPLILAARDKDMDAAAHLEHALELSEARHG